MLRMGVIVTILTIAIDPFSQQLVQIEQNVRYTSEINGIKASSPYAYNYTLGIFRSAVGSSLTENVVTAEPDFSMRVAMLNGLSRPVETIRQQSASQCPSANCTWDAFETLGVCSRCVDVTPDLTHVDNFTDFLDLVESMNVDDLGRGSFERDDGSAYILPNGHALANFAGCLHEYGGDMENPVCPIHVIIDSPIFLMTSYGTGNPNNTLRMHDIDTLIWSLSIIQMDAFEEGTPEVVIKDIDHNIHGETRLKGPWDEWPDTPVRATECALYYCVKSMKPRVEDNVLHEDGKEVTGFQRMPGSWAAVGGNASDPDNVAYDQVSLEFDSETKYLSRQDLALYFPDRSDTRTFNISGEAVYGISSFFQDSLRREWDNGTALDLVRKKHLPDAVAMFNGWVILEGLEPEHPSTLGVLWDRPSVNLTARFDALATSMTNEIRTTALNTSPTGGYSRMSAGGHYAADIMLTKSGRVGVLAVTYRVEWYWLVLHGLILLGGVVFCVATSLAEGGRDVPVWKNHSLAAVRQGSHLAVAELIGDARTTKDMEGSARNGAVRMAVAEKTPLLNDSDADVQTCERDRDEQ
jgi:hypothetical protein